MNAPLPSRPAKPILGSDNDPDGIFVAARDAIPILPTPRLPDAFSWPAPIGESLSFLPLEFPAAQAMAVPAPAPSAPPAVMAEPPRPDPPPSAVLSEQPAFHQPPPQERIVIEELGLRALRVTGTSGGDRLFGGPGDDRLDGLGGDDILMDSPGRDLLYGGPGHDTIRYDLLRAEVSLDTRFQRIGLEDGEDQYDGIEVIDLRDGDWFLTAEDPAALVQRLWLAATGHAPTAAEMIRESAALQAGGTAEALAGSLATGAGEAFRLQIQAALDAPREGGLDQPLWVPDADALLLARLCELGLGGAPGRDAFLHWLDELEGGRSPTSLAAELLATPEGQAQAAYADGQALALAAASWML
ncbi:hypothetical protein EJV46_15055 [Roseococcus sp. SYP-B2431]|uniref:hypothetical protein n=1 Tax=Roseococcus sp. SYP-B2431 TaxID=2496640 RepID=UPI00103D827F|nr:hypothetical protein [Roseococcus sp. SYP-B2431]TCH97447.1 hypothetical protein EJV46_15055 [Roseococcus sp. SYP-B2431]